ncbi:MAG: Fe-S protein assembly co-chaperone HscB [Deltaproteobacteria bacterium]|nr:Fe-S protein assembly co-chaperone HscB [Deltaproteobacteria bacterium]
MTITTDTTLCLNCGKHTARQLACGGCGVVPSSPAREADYFSLFGLPRKLALDVDDLGARYYALSRRFHPDLLQDRPPAEREASVRATALVNNAYRTLKDPLRRGLYWLSLHGESLGRHNERVPPALAARVFEVQEKIEELRDVRKRGDAACVESEVHAIRDDLRGQMRDLGGRLVANFRRSDGADGDGAAAIGETKAVLSELHYVRTLLRDVEKELEPQWSV